jgi:dienelactone hydrolase
MRWWSRLVAKLVVLASLAMAAVPCAAQDNAPAPEQASAQPNAQPSAKKPATTRLADLELEPDAKRPELIPTEVFADRNAFWGEGLSPDGTAMSFLQPMSKGRTRLVVASPQTGERINSIVFGDGTHIGWTRWVSPDRMLINTYVRVLTVGGYVLPMTRLMLAYPREGKVDYLVENVRGYDGGQVLHISPDGEYALIAHRGDGKLWQPSVFKYELKPGGAVTKVIEPKVGITQWVADDAGIVRVGMGWSKGAWQIQYRGSENEPFEQIARIKPGKEEGFFDALAIISGTGKGYVLDEGESGRVGLRVFDYRTKAITETVYENPEWDIEDAWIKDGKPIAAFYTDDRQQVVWFDEDYRQSFEQLREITKTRDLWITDRSDSGKHMLVWAGDESDPGVLYFYDVEARSLREILQYRPKLDFTALARPVPMKYQARDGTTISGYLTLPKGREPKGLPLIILPHGGPFGIRDSLRYDDEVQFLANRGYAVLQPNFRGSGGYGNAFYDLGNGQVGRRMQDDLDDAMDWAVREGIADPARVCVVGGSYGGYAALWSVLRNPERYRCAASWAGVTDWDRMLRYDRRVLTRNAGKRWTARIEGDDGLDLKDVSPFRQANRLSRPVLLAHGTSDDNVPFDQFEAMQKATAQGRVPLTTLIIEGEGHGFSASVSERKWYDALDQFLVAHNPADQIGPDGTFNPPHLPADDGNAVPINLPASAGGK